MNKVNALTINSIHNIKFQKVSKIRFDGSTPTNQKNIEIETSKELNRIEDIKDSNKSRQLHLDSIVSS